MGRAKVGRDERLFASCLHGDTATPASGGIAPTLLSVYIPLTTSTVRDSTHYTHAQYHLEYHDMPIIFLVRGVKWTVKKGYKMYTDHKEGKVIEEQMREEEEFQRAQPTPFILPEHLVTPGPSNRNSNSNASTNVTLELAEDPTSPAVVVNAEEPIDAETLALARSIQRERAKANSKTRANQREEPVVDRDAVDGGDDELPPPAYEEAIAAPRAGSSLASAGSLRPLPRPLPVPSPSPRLSY
ncbi:hypothetical protein PENSPDRAFT_253219 [Peniophora sp. CONT]|nr:hypothetical protein PENSPDRAFT_253219 [Peniophora sp. CONT]